MGQPWILREGSQQSGFRYLDDTGRRVTDRRQLHRIAALVIPPGWRDVHVAPTAASSIQAWGFDVRGRKQYRYNQRAVAKRELRKYHRLRELAKTLPRIRRTIHADAAVRTLGRDAVAAVALRLIGETFCRVGGERYARENGTFGITTLRKTHVRISKGAVFFTYTGKSNVRQRQVSGAPDIVRLIRRLGKTPGRRLFRFLNGTEWRDLTAADVNEYLRRRVGSFTAKDFRTWAGTLRAAIVLAELGPARTPTAAKGNVALAMRLVAAELGNTATVCRNSYVHPMVIARYIDAGETIALSKAKGVGVSARRFAEERALIAFLERHFPERRRARAATPRVAGSRRARVPERRAAA